jgi:hypothetical protein
MKENTRSTAQEKCLFALRNRARIRFKNNKLKYTSQLNNKKVQEMEGFRRLEKGKKG